MPRYWNKEGSVWSMNVQDGDWNTNDKVPAQRGFHRIQNLGMASRDGISIIPFMYLLAGTYPN